MTAQVYRKGHASNDERLLDLAEIARFALEGQRVTQVFFAERIHPLSSNSTSTVIRRLIQFAKLLGHEIRSEPDPEQDGSWIVVPADPQKLLWAVTQELEAAGVERRRAALRRPRTKRELRHRQYIRERREGLRANGLCIHCATPVSGCDACAPCRAQHAEWTLARREDRKARGVCWRCESPVEGEAVHCRLCAESVARIAADRRRKASAAGFCSRCATRRAEEGRRYCRTCLDQEKACKARRRQRQGVERGTAVCSR